MNTARLLLLISVILLASCKGDDDAPGDLQFYGSGDYNFTGYAPFSEKPIKCFFHIPEGSSASAPILMVAHGAGRNGQSLRNALVAAANEKKFIVLAPQFSETYFPGTNAFNLAAIFANGEQPTPEGIMPEETWTFQAFDPLFQDFKARSGSAAGQYDLFGHSAGAQLVHRFFQFEPDAGFNRLVTSAAGWYMVPDPGIDFPYGQGISPAVHINPAFYFERSIQVVVGALDTDPNSFNLRHTPEADAQGVNRVQRAHFFYETSMQLAEDGNHPFLWQYHEAPDLGHDATAMAIFAASLLYD